MDSPLTGNRAAGQPNKTDYTYFGFVLLYCAYCVIRNYLYPFYGYEMESDLPMPMVVVDVVLMLVVLGFVVVTLSRHNWSASQWGLTTGKDTWYGVAFIVFAIVYLGRNMSPFAVGDIYQAVAITVSVVGYELVFRASLIGRLTSLLGRGKKGIFLSVLISSILYGIVLLPLDSFSGLAAGSVLFLGYLYYLLGSILLLIFFVVGFATPNEQGAYVGLVALVIYFALTVMARALERRRNLAKGSG